MSCSAVQHQESYPRVTPSTSASFNEHCCPPSLPYPLPHRKAHTVRKPFVCDGYRVAHGDATKNKAPKFKTRPPRVSKTNTEPIFYFMWSPPRHVSSHIEYILYILSDIFSAMLSGIFSDNLYHILPGILSDFPCDTYSAI